MAGDQRPAMRALTLWIVLSLGPLTVGTRLRGTENCPNKCFCLPRNVYCDNKGLSRIPDRIPDGVTQLKLDKNRFTNSVVTRASLGGLTALEHLYLSECGLTGIEVGAFSDMRLLQFLDLSKNQLSYLDRATFQDVQLQHLFLGGNRGLQLHQEAFVGLSVQGLDLHECNLQSIHLTLLSPLNGTLHNLWLDSNALMQIDAKFEPFFRGLRHLRLAGNPLHCNCDMRWLHLLYIESPPDFHGNKLPTCFSPPSLRGQNFADIESAVMLCTPPTFSDIDAVLEPSGASLHCRAEGDPLPDLYWVSPNGPIHKAPAGTGQSSRNTATLHVPANNDLSGQYYCVADNSVGRRTFTFNVTWPSLTTQVASTTPTPSTTTPTTTPPLPTYAVKTQTSLQTITAPNNWEHEAGGQGSHIQNNTKEGYTLRELILAVLGTFAGTLLLCLIVARIYIQRRQNQDGSSTSLEKPPLEQEALYQPPPQPLLASTPTNYHAVNLQDYLIKANPPTLPRR